MTKLNPEEDGLNHINIYSQGKTDLGKLLSNFYRCEIKTTDGIFNSVEGYWYWLGLLSDNNEKDHLRKLSGYDAKKFGEQIKTKEKRFDPNFEKKILQAIFQKIFINKNIVIANRNKQGLSLEHYYVYGNKIIDVKNKYLWMIDGIEKILNFIWFLY